MPFKDFPGIAGRDENFFLLGRMCEHFGLGDALRYVEEIAASDLAREFEERVAHVPTFVTKTFNSPFEFRLFRLALYTLVREMRPQAMIETGVLHGMTSAFILEAMAKNGTGRLTSIDLPSSSDTGPANTDGIQATLPKAQQSGWIVSERLAKRWTLKLGSSLDLLPGVFADAPQIDIFLHDSDHVYPLMWDEMRMAWEHLREGGIMVCDNIDYSRAFFDFCRGVGQPPFVLSAPNQATHSAIRFGMVRK